MNVNTKVEFAPYMRKGIAQMVIPGKDFALTFKLVEGNNTADDSKYVLTTEPDLESDLKVVVKHAGLITSFDSTAIKRTFPTANSKTHNPLHLVYAEFKETDFLWRYSPEAVTEIQNGNKQKLPSWLYLLVLEADEFTWQQPSEGGQNGALAKIEVKGKVFKKIFKVDTHANGNSVNPQHAASAHLWASVQKFSNNSISSAEDQGLVGRLFGSRKLQPNKGYHAFLVPHYKVGQERGLNPGEELTTSGQITISTQKFYELTNVTDETSIILPVYHHWMFNTREEESFLTYAKAIKPLSSSTSLSGFETSISKLGYGLEQNLSNNEAFLIEGLYGTPNLDDDNDLFVSAPYTNLELMDEVRQLINHGLEEYPEQDPGDPDPAVVPPAYGYMQSKYGQLLPKQELTLDDDTWDPWYYEVNLDPRYRAIAGLGAQVIRENQTYFVDQALEQFYEFQEVNAAIGNVQNNHGVNSLVQGRILTSENTEYSTQFYGPVQDQIILGPEHGSVSLATYTSNSLLGSGFLSARFRNLTAPRSNKFRKFTGTVSHDTPIGRFIVEMGLTTRTEIDYSSVAAFSVDAKLYAFFLNCISAYRPESEPDDGRTYMGDYNFYSPGYSTVPANIDTVFYQNLQNYLLSYAPRAIDAESGIVLQSRPDFDFTYVNSSIAQRQSANSITARSLERLGIIERRPSTDEEWQAEELPLETIEVTPTYQVPMVKYLAKDYPEFLMPQLENLPDNSVALVAANDKFVEAYMIGLNQELASEFRWRNLPVNKHGTYFRLFWDKSDNVGTNPKSPDIPEIQSWSLTSKLGKNVLGSTATNTITILVKAELFRKYPDTVVFLQRAIDTNNGPGMPINVGSNPNTVNQVDVKFPLKQVRAKNNIVSFTFSLDLEDALAGAGWFIVFQERPSGLTFGFELTRPGSTYTWNHLVPDASDCSSILLTTPTASQTESSEFSREAILVPNRIYIHLSNFLPNE